MNNIDLKQKEFILKLRYRLTPFQGNSKVGSNYNLKILSVALTGQNIFETKIFSSSAAGFSKFQIPKSNDNFLQTFTCE